MWEYRKEFRHNYLSIDELNEIGKDKWEMCGFSKVEVQENYAVSNNMCIYYFKRQILEYDM